MSSSSEHAHSTDHLEENQPHVTATSPESPPEQPLLPFVSDDETPPYQRKETAKGTSRCVTSSPTYSAGPSTKRQRIEPRQEFTARTDTRIQNWQWYPGLIRHWVRGEGVPPPLTPDTPLHMPALPPAGYPLEQAFAAHVAAVDRELRENRRLHGIIDSLRSKNELLERRIEHQKQHMLDGDECHNKLVKLVHKLESKIVVLTMQTGENNARTEAAENLIATLQARVATADARATAALAEAAEARAMVIAANVQEEEDPEEEPEQEIEGDEDAESEISSADDMH